MQFQNLYQDYDYEVIIVDDASDEEHKIKDFEEQFPNTRVIEITKKEKGTRLNPSVVYNKGFSEAVGEIIIIQNPECYHVGNILSHVIENLQEQDYFSYSCFAANSPSITQELLNESNPFEFIHKSDLCKRDKDNYCRNATDLSRETNWYNHPNYYDNHGGKQTGYHYCSAIYKHKLDLIGGFDERFASGYCFDDDAFLLEIRHGLKLNVKIIDPVEGFVIHQFHPRDQSYGINEQPDSHPIKKKWLKNKKLYEEMKLRFLNNEKEI